MSKKALFGIIIVIIGVNIFFSALFSTSGSLIAPIIFFVLGLFFYQKKRKLLAALFFIVSASVVFDQLLGLNLISLLIAILLLYYGLKLVRAKPMDEAKRERRERRRRKETRDKWRDEVAEEGEQERENRSNDRQTRVVTTSTIRRSLIGDVHYTREQFELDDMTIWNGFGDVRIDLSKAIIPEGETVIIIQGIIGQIDVFVPDDLALAIQATTMIGEVSLFHEKHSGINQQLNVSSQSYKQAPRRVKFVLSTMIGEVKVRAV